MTRRPGRLARPGFDPARSWALVLFGLALPRLRFDQALALEASVRALGASLLAAPHGDLSAPVDDPLPFALVVGAVAARASVRSSQDARCRPARFDGRDCRTAEQAFTRARAALDARLHAAGLRTDHAPGLFVLGAGPLASARLEARSTTASVRRQLGPGELDEPRRALEVTWDAEPDALRVELAGTFALLARYD